MLIISEKLKEFLIDTEKLSEEEIQPSTRIAEDLGIDGIDTLYFMDSYFETFPIDVGDFDLRRYSSDETQVLLIIPMILFALFRFLIWQLLMGKPAIKLTTEPVTLAMLQQAIDDGVWNCARLESLAGTQVYPPPSKKSGWFARIRSKT
ncbi:MAG: DUF1493 family protein [Acetobacter papayae]|uniref:hypothetical protein n=1 Tax=Acetobacter papayae TaxID=1076592 RepID=UPI0039E81E91